MRVLRVFLSCALACGCAAAPATEATPAADEGFLGSEFPDLPRDAAEVVERLAACHHFAGEHTGGNSPVRDQEVADAVSRLRCDVVDRDVEVLRKKYADDRSVQEAITAADR
jgi:hypothetical protein